MRYNIPLMNALVLYVGVQAINYIRNKNLAPNMTTIAHSSHMDIFQNLAVDLDTEGRLRTYHDQTPTYNVKMWCMKVNSTLSHKIIIMQKASLLNAQHYP